MSVLLRLQYASGHLGLSLNLKSETLCQSNFIASVSKHRFSTRIYTALFPDGRAAGREEESEEGRA